MNFVRCISIVTLLLASASSASAQINYTEPPDLSNNVGAPTALTLGVGSNSVAGSVATPGDRQDNFTVTVPAGAQLTAVSLTLNTGGGFIGSVTWNLSEVRSSSGSFTTGLPAGPGTYYVQVITDFAIGNAWSTSFTVASIAPICGNGVREGAEACDDGNATQCDGCSNTCTTVLNGCFIGGSCVAEGTLDPANACRGCRRTASRTMYSPMPAGTSCDDGQYCTAVDTCNGSGTCGGTTRSCVDALSCTTDLCDEAGDRCTNTTTVGCLIGGTCIAEGAAQPGSPCSVCRGATSRTAYSPAAAGASCDDGLFCTDVDTCNGTGSCGGTARSCGDGLACTSDACDEAGDACTHATTDGCLIGGACIAEGAADPANACMVCTAATSSAAYSPAAVGTGCDDGAFCTDVDTCDGAGACGGTARVCDDALECTTDACDESADACSASLASGCLIDGACVAEGALDPANDCMACDAAMATDAYSALATGTACDDALFCTDVDACDGAGVCAGTARVCDDGDVCTDDACDETGGACTTTPIAGCGVDGGTDVDGGSADGGTADAGPPRDAGPRTDAPGSGSDAGTATPPVEGGCACRTGATPAPGSFGIVVFGLVAALVARRRR